MDMPEGIPAPIMQSSTEVMLPGSETPVTVKVGQVDEGVPVLSREEFQKASAIQKARDRAIEEKKTGTNAQPKTKTGLPLDPPIAPSPAAPSAARPSGKPSPVRRTTSDPKTAPRKSKTPPVARDPRFNALEARISEMEEGQALVARGMDKVIEMLAARDKREFDARNAPQDLHISPGQPTTFQDASTALNAGGEEEEVTDAAPRRTEEGFGSLSLAEELDDEDIDMDVVEAVEADSPDEAVVRAPAVAEDSFEAGDPAIARLQAHIARKNPLKDFRRFWASIIPRAGFTEWPIEMQERFTETFNNTVRHPKLLYQVRRAMLKMRNGQCIGEEQMYKAVLMLAGHCVLYSIITQED